MKLQKNSVWIRKTNGQQIIFNSVQGYTFDWNGVKFGLWNKKRGQWILTDIPTGCSIIQITNKQTLRNYLTDQLWNKLEEIYNREFYKRESQRLALFLKDGVIYENIR